MDVGHRQVVHEDLSSGYTDICVLFIGGWLWYKVPTYICITTG